MHDLFARTFFRHKPAQCIDDPNTPLNWNFSLKKGITESEIPALSGVLGPGDITIPLGFNRSISESFTSIVSQDFDLFAELIQILNNIESE